MDGLDFHRARGRGEIEGKGEEMEKLGGSRGDRSCRGVKGGIYRIAGIIFQKESRRGQTLSWWREGSGKGGRRGGRVAREAGRLPGWQGRWWPLY